MLNSSNTSSGALNSNPSAPMRRAIWQIICQSASWSPRAPTTGFSGCTRRSIFVYVPDTSANVFDGRTTSAISVISDGNVS